MSKRRLPEVELNPVGFTPVQHWPDTPTRHGKSRLKPSRMKVLVLLILALFVLSIVSALVISAHAPR